MKILFVIAAVALSTGCATRSVNVRTQVQEVKVPILYCPAPPEFNRPNLKIHTLTEKQLKSDGEVAKAYVASVLQLLGYTEELEQIINNYDTNSEAFKELQRRIDNGETDFDDFDFRIGE